MRLLLKIKGAISTNKNVKDIVDNFTEISLCNRVWEVAKESYLAVTDNYKYNYS
jgi:hypothetical protein